MKSTHSEKASHLIDADIESVRRELTLIREEMVAEVARSQSHLHAVHPNYEASAKNLLHYLALRRRDLRSLQRRLAGLGLSSLGRAESHVLSTVDTVLEVLYRLTGGTCRPSREKQQRLLITPTVSGCSSNTPTIYWASRARDVASGSWSRCLVKQQTTIPSCIPCSSRAWIVCASIVPMMRPRHGRE